MMEQEFTQRTSAYSRRLRSTTLVRIRWLAVFSQSSTIAFVTLYLGFKVPIIPCAILIIASVWLNIFLTFYYSINDRLSSTVATAILGVDILQYATLLYFTGGLQNPFSLLLIAPAVISATSLPVKHIVFLNFLVIISASVLSTYSDPLPWYPGHMIITPRLLVDGIWTAIVSSLIFTTTYGYRVAEETRRLADALSATELILQHEKHLSELDGLAAAAAHELGTPLATIQLVAKEMYNGLKNNPDVEEDLSLLLSQTERCRNILKRLTSLSTDGEKHLSRLSLSTLLDEVSSPLKEFGVEIVTEAEEAIGEEPVFPRNPGILYGVGNLLENAVDFARSKVTIRYKWNEKYVGLTIIDDGHGYDPSILDRIGEPYTTSRQPSSQGGGLGLGLFIAKTLLERSGAQLHFRNSPKKELGAEVYLVWNRKKLS